MNLLPAAALLLAAIPAALFVVNLFAYRPPRPGRRSDPTPDLAPSVSILIPARNEEDAITHAVEAALTHPAPALEVVVLDDHSTDQTAARVEDLIRRDPRVRLIHGRPLPDGWCGKQHACWQLAQAAQNDLLLFVDADVRLAPDAVPRLVGHLGRHPEIHLLSGVPRQQTGTVLEHLLIPLIHFILLGFLPIPAARQLRNPAFAAGCGQLFLARRAAYFACDGHRSIRASLHDGVQLPRSFRRAGFFSDLVDLTPLAVCRMYRSGTEVWRGLGKNATEGLGHPAAIVPWTLLLLGGQVLPWILLAMSLFKAPASPDLPALVLACTLTLLPRLLGINRFRQDALGALLHPLGILLLLAIQWQALARHRLGRPMEWRGRAYPPEGTTPARTAIP